jgi:hypothetical protein
MLSAVSPRRINTYSIRRYHLAHSSTMSAPDSDHREASSSSSLKRKRDDPPGSPQGKPQPDTKVTKRVSTRLGGPFFY